jgi:hypothetical protein
MVSKFGFSAKILFASHHLCYLSCYSHSPSFDHSNNIIGQVQCVQVSRKLGDSVEHMQHSSQITAAAADSRVSHSADIRTPSVGLTFLLQ